MGPGSLSTFVNIAGALRLSDVPAYVRKLGFSSERLPSKTFQGTSMHHQGVHVGNFYLVEKQGGEAFTREDEEVLLVFAAQAATAIANAHTHQAEQRARAGLEALIDTSPVGVVVFDAKSGQIVSLNREAKRIVEALRIPGRSTRQLLEVITFRRADGREIALSELPLVRELSDADTVRAEEIVLSVPDGRTITTLINATPIHCEEGAVESLVVTLQDLAPLEELERMRANFLSMVSHELRMPLTSIKGSTATVLGASRRFGLAEMQQFFRMIDEQVDRMSELIADLLDAGRLDTGTLSVLPEPSHIGALVDQARTTFLSSGTPHTLLIDLPADLPQVMADRQRIIQVLNNLLSNAARHAPASSPIRIVVAHEGLYVAVSVSDEGSGMTPKQLAHLFHKYAKAGSGGREVGGGLGLAICKGLIEAQGGRIRAESGGLGQGTRVTFTIPVVEADSAAPGDTLHRPAALKGDERMQILVVDDDPQTLRYVRDALEEAGYCPLITGDHENLSNVIQMEKPQLVLLDLMLSGTDGIELMKTVPALAELPVIFISGYGRDETIARALDAGADDYIVKPFSPTELTARIRATLRRHNRPEPFMLGELAIDYEQRLVTMAGDAVELTVTEYELLRVLSLNAGRVASFESLLRQVWNRQSQGDPKIVRAFIKMLRKKLGDDSNRPRYIFNVRGVGYRMARPGDTA